jgi:carbon monoxide dehydrogenase subunit G
VGCVPGAELVETVDDHTFKGRVRIKVGPITVSYSGNAEITDRNADAHTAVLKASGRETTGSGSARATATMSVSAKDSGSEVKLATDFAVAGRVANFGRGVMEDVSRRLVGQMANCIKANLEVEEPPATEQPAAPEAPPAAEAVAAETPPSETPAPPAPAPSTPTGDAPHEAAIPPAAPMGGISAPATTGEAVTGEPGSSQQTPAPTPPATPPAAAAPAARRPVTTESKPIGAVGLFFAVLGDRIRRLFGGGRS